MDKMKMYRRYAASLLALILMAPLAVVILGSPSVFSQSVAPITGRVVNRTHGASVPGGLKVTLRTLDDAGSLDDETVNVNEDGEFRFDGVVVNEAYAYGMFADYQDVRYSLQIASLPPDDPVELAIYETGATGEDISFGSNVLIIGWADSQEGVVGVLENIGIINSSDRSYVPAIGDPSAMNLLRFPLPPAYTNLDVQSNLGGGQVVPVDKGFGLTAPVPPGHYEVFFTYLVEYEGGSLTFERSFPFGAASFSVLVPEDVATVTVPGLGAAEQTDIGGTTYARLEGENIPRGTRLSINVQGLPSANFVEKAQNTLWNRTAGLIAIPALLGLALIGLFVYFVLPRRPAETAFEAGATSSPIRRQMIASIAELDDRYERSEIEQKEYEEKREKLKGQLLHEPQEPEGG